ncbi:MAG: 4'-phosphopantetheinyl transferase superfamily protein [Rhodanobacter sp.]
MIASVSQSLTDASTRLEDDVVHVWSLDYRPALGRQPLLQTLAAYLGIGVAEVVLVEGAHGRPQLDAAHDSRLDFNWSHSGEHALIAVARGIAPGIDVERRRPRPRALPLARRFFDSEETTALAALPEDARAAAFLELWTAKEALLKAHGHGISYGLNRLRILSTPERLRLVHFDGENIGAWQLQRLAVAPNLIAALAWRGPARTIEMGWLASAE